MIYAVILLLIGLVLLATRIWFRNHNHLWFPSYVRWSLDSSSGKEQRHGLLYIMLLIADHFEPGRDNRYLAQWIENYRAVASKHRDRHGHHPCRTLHYPVEQFQKEQIEMMLPLCRERIAEIELQLHHFDDDSQSVRKKYEQGLADFAEFGVCQTIDSPAQTRFAFVHGNWALDNSGNHQNPNPCGVNDEIRILASLGCFLDVTFPAVTTSCQPRRINSIYYATDDPSKPKSYDDGIPVEVGKAPTGDLMLLQGPLLLNWRDWRKITHPAIENGDIHRSYPTSPKRIPLWMKANIHVLGQPDWIFVKLHSHGCRQVDGEAIWGASFDQTLTALESDYNDGHQFFLHYVSVREAYNIIKAAEAGKQGDPEEYRDFLIKPYRAGR